MPLPARPHRRAIRIFGVAAVALVGVLGGACSSSTPSASVDVTSPPSADGTTPGTGSTYEIVPDAVVTAGLTEVRRDAAAIKAAQTTDPASTKAMVTAMYDTWYEFEGTVRKQEKNLYLQMEDGLSAIKAGVEQQNMTKIDKGIADLEAGATGYLKAHP